MLYRPRKHKEKSQKRGRKKKNSESSEVRLKIQIKTHQKFWGLRNFNFPVIKYLFFGHTNEFVSL